MKAILLAPLPPPVGGIAKWATSMTNSELKHNWEIVPLQTNLHDVEIYRQINKHSYISEIKRCFWIWKRLRKELRDKDTKIVHSNIPANFLSILREIVSAMITRIFGKSFVVHYHCTLPQKVHDRKTLIAIRFLARIVPNVIVLNRQSETYIEKYTKAKAYLIPNFVENDTILKNKKIINDTIKTALYVGGVVECKGCDIIIEVAKRFPDIVFRFVGYISDEYRRRELPCNVKLVGVKTGLELKKEYCNADVFLFLSHMDSEGFSIALTEAMAYGLPCIATDWAANKDMIGDTGGIIVPIKDAKKVVDAINTLNMNMEFRQKASERNVQTVINMYSQQNVPNMFVDAYEDIMKRNGIK